MVFDPLGCISSSGVMNQTLQIIRFWKTSVLQNLVKKYAISIPPPGLVQTRGIQAYPQSHLMCRLNERFSGYLREFACAICVFDQYHPPCYTSLINFIINCANYITTFCNDLESRRLYRIRRCLVPPLSSPLWIWKNLGLWKFFNKNIYVKKIAFELTVN